MVWARELLHGRLATAGGPSFKVLPVLAAAPLTPFGDLAPMAWLWAARTCGLVALLLAWRVGNRLGGAAAGAIAVLPLAVGPDLFRTSTYGSSEPLLLVCVLGSASAYLGGRRTLALAMLALGGLLRPELWAIVGALTIVETWSERRVRAPQIAAALVPPVLWLGLEWLGSGSPFTQFIDPFGVVGGCLGCSVALLPPPLTALPQAAASGARTLGLLSSAVVPPVLALAALAVGVAVARRRRDVLVLGAVAVAWVLIVAAMTQVGYPGSRRYLLGPAALLAVLAGRGAADAQSLLAQRRSRAVAGVATAGLIAAFGLSSTVSNLRLMSVARAEARLIAGLSAAIRASGGRDAIVRGGRPAVNGEKQSALAWRLDVPLAAIQPTWHSSRRRPGWAPPAYVFRTSARLAGPAPYLGRRPAALTVARRAGWTVTHVP
jgi:hypothetical protein